MAPSYFFAPVFALLLLVPLATPTCTAKEFMVGDEAGWTIGFDYQAWASGKDFHVRTLGTSHVLFNFQLWNLQVLLQLFFLFFAVFKHPKGAHNVYKINTTDFQSCTPPVEAIPFTAGNDKVILATPGPKWYLCGVGEHCDVGNQKLSITVKSKAVAASPSPSQSVDSYYSNNVEKISHLGTMTAAFVGRYSGNIHHPRRKCTLPYWWKSLKTDH